MGWGNRVGEHADQHAEAGVSGPLSTVASVGETRTPDVQENQIVTSEERVYNPLNEGQWPQISEAGRCSCS